MARSGGRHAIAHSTPPQQPEIVDHRLRRLYEYWQRERGMRPLPSRTDIDPRQLKFLLGYLSLLDVLKEPLRFRVRLQGTELGWWLGGDFTGRTLDQLPASQLAAVIHQRLANAVNTAAPCHHRGEEIIADLPRRYEALILPLATDGMTVNMLLTAVLCPNGDAAL